MEPQTRGRLRDQHRNSVVGAGSNLLIISSAYNAGTRAIQLTRSGNSEIAFQWLLMSIRNRYEPGYPRLEEFLMTIGRRKFIKPLYEELAKTPEGLERAVAIYRRARPTYHPIAVTSIDAVLKWPAGN